MILLMQPGFSLEAKLSELKTQLDTCENPVASQVPVVGASESSLATV